MSALFVHGDGLHLGFLEAGKVQDVESKGGWKSVKLLISVRDFAFHSSALLNIISAEPISVAVATRSDAGQVKSVLGWLTRLKLMMRT